MAQPRSRRRPSTIDRLDPQIRDLIGKLRIDKGWTIDEIREHLEKLLEQELLPSRSALGRHIKSLEEIGAQLRHSREVAQALIAQVGDAPEDRVVDLNIELMHTAILRLVTATDDEGDGQPVTFKPKEAMEMARAIQSLVGAKKTSADMVLKLRQEATRDAAEKAGAAARSKGLGKETVDFITNAVLGVDA